MTLNEKIITDVVKCRAAGYLPKRLLISRSELNKLAEEVPDVDSGVYYGLEITIVGEGCPAHVLPK